MTSTLGRFPAGVRWQATVAAGTVVAFALVMGSLGLLLVLHNSLTGSLQSSITSLVAEDARTLADQGLGAMASGESDRGEDGILVQVID
ncbi:MAG: hypothetical protein WCG47_01710, partial [Dermatophilaceae bacterium]